MGTAFVMSRSVYQKNTIKNPHVGHGDFFYANAGLVVEQADARKRHHNAMRIAGVDHILVAF